MNGRGKWAWMAVAIAGVVLVVVFLWRGRGGETAAPGGGRREGPVVAVELAPVQRGEIREVRALTGTLLPGNQFNLAAKVAGRLMELRVDIGDEVRRGQVVAVLDGEEFAQQLVQAEAEQQMAAANVEEAQSNLVLARREVERIRLLRERQISTQADLDSAEAQLLGQQARLRVAEATVEQRRAATENARLRLSHTQVRAEWSGGEDVRWVGERFADEGANVTANETLVTVVDLDPLRAVVFITERDYARLRTGQTASISVDAHPRIGFTGEIARMAPIFREASRQARVELRVPNPDGLLRPGMFARVRLELERQPDATLVPRDAVVRRNGSMGVFQVTEDNLARFVPVETGIVEGQVVQILSPELEGEVVTLGQNQLTPGAPVRVPGQAPASRQTSAPRRASAGGVGQ
jgi:RND family efflux transporter MFP subunit